MAWHCTTCPPALCRCALPAASPNPFSLPNSFLLLENAARPCSTACAHCQVISVSSSVILSRGKMLLGSCCRGGEGVHARRQACSDACCLPSCPLPPPPPAGRPCRELASLCARGSFLCLRLRDPVACISRSFGRSFADRHSQKLPGHTPAPRPRCHRLRKDPRHVGGMPVGGKLILKVRPPPPSLPLQVQPDPWGRSQACH